MSTKKISRDIELKAVKMYTSLNADGTWTGGKTIGRLLGITPTSVQNILARNNIKRRSSKEAFASGKRTKPIKNLPKKGSIAPLCKCGCGLNVEWNKAKNGWNIYFKKHYHPVGQKFKNREWLYSEYVVKQRMMEDIAQDFGVYHSTIRYWLKKNGIPRRKQKDSLAISGSAKGDKNPAWKGGIAKWDYSRDWKAVCREIKNRDKWTCRRCGEQRKHWGIHLHVHHIDGNKFNNDESNLISLCSKCHALAHSKNGM